MERIAVVGYGIFAYTFSLTLSVLSAEYSITLYVPTYLKEFWNPILGEHLPSERLLAAYGIEIRECDNVKVRVPERKVVSDSTGEIYDYLVISPPVIIKKYGRSYHGLNYYTILLAQRERSEICVRRREISMLADSDMWEAFLREAHARGIRIRRREYATSSLVLSKSMGVSFDKTLSKGLEINEGVYTFGLGIKLRDSLGLEYCVINPAEEYHVGVLLATAFSSKISFTYKAIRTEHLLLGDLAYVVIGLTKRSVKRPITSKARDSEIIMKIIYDPRRCRVVGIQALGKSEIIAWLVRYYQELLREDSTRSPVRMFMSMGIFTPSVSNFRNAELIALEGLLRKIGPRDLRRLLSEINNRDRT